MGKLTDIINVLFGCKTNSRRNRYTNQIGIAETKILAPHDDRLSFIIVNLGANNAYILNETGVSATNGIVLTANGGHYIAKYDEDFHMVGDNWYGIAPGGVVNILCLEVIGT